MKLLTAQEMQKLDRWAINKLGIPRIALMENAGRAVAENIPKGQKVCVVAYKGNNGGDGFVAARHLTNLGFQVSVFLLCRKNDISGSAKINLDILRKMKVPIHVQSLTTLAKLLKSSDIVIDAIFGIGFSGTVTGKIAKAIDLINTSKKYVVAVDVPSGINATNGKADKHAVKADLTVTFAYPKTGLLKYPAVKNVGKLIVADIGIPKLHHEDTKARRTQFLIPKRLTWTNKGDYGRVLVIAGSKNMSGAAYLTAQAAIRSGAGLVYLAVPQSIQKIVAPKTREVITIGLPETREGTLSLKAFKQIMKIKADVVAIGPGLTTQAETKQLVIKLIRQLIVPRMVIDADGLNCIADDPAILRKSNSKIIITPHPGEMSRLIGKNITQIQKNRVKIAQSVAQKWQVEVVLKGAYTIIADGKKAWINSSGNPGMAKAGSGDVLTGMIAGFAAQGLSTQEAVYVHGLAGDLAAEEKGTRGMLASDIIEKIPYALRRIS